MALRKIFICFSLLALSLSGLMTSTPAQAQYGASGIIVELNKGTIIRLPDSATVVAVADPQIADVEVLSPQLVSLQGRGIGQTTVVAFNGAGDEILNDVVTVTHNISSLNSIMRSVMPENDIIFNSIDGALVVSGNVDSPLEAETISRIATPFLAASGDALVNMLNIRNSDQVLLQVKIAEVSRSELKRFGINLSAVLSSGGTFAFGLVNGRSLVGSTVGNISRNAGDNAIQMDYTRGDGSLTSVIDALADDGLVRVLAEPNLTTASGRSASFLAGGEIPIPVPGQDGQVTIEWREFGVSLNFAPEVISKDKISLSVAPEVSELTQDGAVSLQGFNIPALSTRRAETTVELGSGQSFAIAGLLQHTSSSDISKFPGLGDIPILGALFRSNEYRNDQSELVILVTPYIVRGVPEQELATPDEGLTPPSDAERLLLGRHYRPDVPPRATGDVPEPVITDAQANEASVSAAAPVPPVANRNVTPPPMHAPTPVAKPVPRASINGPVGFMVR